MTSLRKTALLVVLLAVVVSGFSPTVVVSGFSRTLTSVVAQEAAPPAILVEPGALPKAWMNFFILRESGCIHDEKPFLYLILSPRAPRP